MPVFVGMGRNIQGGTGIPDPENSGEDMPGKSLCSLTAAVSDIPCIFAYNLLKASKKRAYAIRPDKDPAHNAVGEYSVRTNWILYFEKGYH